MFRIQPAQMLAQENQQLKQQYNHLVQHTNKLQEEINKLKITLPRHTQINEKDTYVVSFLKRKNALLSQEIVKKNQTIRQMNEMNGKFVLSSCNSCHSGNNLDSISEIMSDLTE
jgi:FtsZ-binding cell division protein ZapB